jgi:hypothetical protein
MKVDSSGNLIIADSRNHAVRKVSPDGMVTTVTGGSTADHVNHPWGIAIDNQGNIYITDTGNHAIRKPNLNGNVSTLTGGSPSRNGN